MGLGFDWKHCYLICDKYSSHGLFYSVVVEPRFNQNLSGQLQDVLQIHDIWMSPAWGRLQSGWVLRPIVTCCEVKVSECWLWRILQWWQIYFTLSHLKEGSFLLFSTPLSSAVFQVGIFHKCCCRTCGMLTGWSMSLVLPLAAQYMSSSVCANLLRQLKTNRKLFIEPPTVQAM